MAQRKLEAAFSLLFIIFSISHFPVRQLAELGSIRHAAEAEQACQQPALEDQGPAKKNWFVWQGAAYT